MLSRIVITVTFLLLSLSGFATSKADSLKSIYKNPELPDTTRVHALKELAGSVFMYSKPDSAFFYAQLQYELAEKAGYSKGMSAAIIIQGSSHFLRGNLEEALEKFEKGLEFSKKIDEKKGIASSLTGIGLVAFRKGNYVKALDYALKGLAIKEEISDNVEIAGSYNNIGVIFDQQGNKEKALEYHLKARKIQEEINNPTVLYSTLNNIALLYTDQEKYDLAIENQKRAIELSKEINNKRGTAASLNNLALAYQKQGEYELAEQAFFESLKIDEEIGFTVIKAKTLNGLAELAFLKKEYENAEKYALEAFKLANEKGLTFTLKAASKTLYLVYKEQGRIEEALTMFEVHTAKRDSLEAIDVQKDLLQKEFDYLYEKQKLEEELNLAHQKKVDLLKRKTERYSLIALFCLVLGGIGVYIKIRSIRTEAEKIELLQEIKLLKAKSHLGVSSGLDFSKTVLDEEKIDLAVNKKLNPSDWKIIHVLCENPTITNAAIADKVALSVHGVSSSLKKMYRLFELNKQKENQKMALVAKVIRISNP